MNISKKQTKRKTEYFDPSRSHTCKALGDKIIEMIYEMDGASKDIIVICIGTDRATGDALGPLVGDYILAHNTTYQGCRHAAIPCPCFKYQGYHRTHLCGL